MYVECSAGYVMDKVYCIFKGR